MAAPTPEYLRERLALDEATGILTWKLRPESAFKAKTLVRRLGICLEWNARYAGKQAFHTMDKTGAALIGKLDRDTYRTMRVVWAMVYGEWPPNDRIVCPRDLDPLNCRPGNLILVSHATKRYRARSTNGLGRKGVRHRTDPKHQKKPYAAAIMRNGKEAHLGYFVTAQEANAAYETAASALIDVMSHA